METLRGLIDQFADTPFPVLIEGESGSGKELVAQCLHQHSEKASLPFLTINCATFTADLLEAQLFGHSKGAFTGADKATTGFFEEAGKGSLVLDEIGELPLGLQAKLLRVLENGEFYRLGETQPRTSKCRVITATNRDLREEVRTGRFRADLYHRLSVLTISVPPLRERGNDSLLLLRHFRQVYSSSLTPFKLDKSVEKVLADYSFPGNVRELRNIVIRLAAKYPGAAVGIDELSAELESAVTSIEGGQDGAADRNIEQQLLQKGFRLDQQMDEWERAYITAALKLAGGNLSKAARLLGVNRTTLYSKIERLSMDMIQ
jgi:DNA-binding NtrC family response regulator